MTRRVRWYRFNNVVLDDEDGNERTVDLRFTIAKEVLATLETPGEPAHIDCVEIITEYPESDDPWYQAALERWLEEGGEGDLWNAAGDQDDDEQRERERTQPDDTPSLTPWHLIHR